MEQQTGLNRNTIDKYYTKKNIVDLCIRSIKSNIKISKKDLCIEPSAGNGSFINKIKTLSNNHLFLDIEPENDEIQKNDFLEYDYDDIVTKYKNIHVIGNPPFGRQSTTAIKFIKKCCNFASSISFILPKSFKKQSMQNYFSLNYHLIHEYNLPKNSFLVNDIECDVPCVFQIWIRKNELRIKIENQQPINFEFVKQNENPDISFRRVGVYASKIDIDTESKSKQSHYFIKFTNNKTIDENIKLLSKCNFIFDNTVGPRSISKPELINQFNRFLI